MVHALKCLLAVAPSAALVAYARDWFDWMHGSKLIGVSSLGFLALVAAGLYFAFALILRISDADLIIGMVKRRIRR